MPQILDWMWINMSCDGDVESIFIVICFQIPFNWNLVLLKGYAGVIHYSLFEASPGQPPHPSPRPPPIPLISTKLTRPVRISWVSVTLYPTTLNISPVQHNQQWCYNKGATCQRVFYRGNFLDLYNTNMMPIQINSQCFGEKNISKSVIDKKISQGHFPSLLCGVGSRDAYCVCI